MGKHSTNYNLESLPKEVRPISSWGYVGYTILYSIPVIGLLFLIIFSFSHNKNRRNFARSYWCRLLIALIIIALCALGYVIFREQINEVISEVMTDVRANVNEMDLSWLETTGTEGTELPEVTEEDVQKTAEEAVEMVAEEVPEIVEEAFEEEIAEDDIAE